jgi:hypothetical protein
MYINRIYVNQVALAWSLADSAAALRNNPKPIPRRRESLSGATDDSALTHPERWMAVFKQTLFGLR